MSVEVPQVLQLQGGSPQVKAGSVFWENLKSVQAQEGGALSGGVMSLLSSSGIGGLMAGNPIASLATAAQTAIGAMQGAVSGIGATASATALGGLSTAIGSLSGTAASLLGLAAGTYGPLDVVLHFNTVGMAGNPAPVAVSGATVLAPTTSGPLVTTTQGSAQTITNAVLAGTTSDAAGAAQIASLTASIQTVIDGSGNAISGLRAMITTLATAQAFGGAMAAGTRPGATGDQAALNAWLAAMMDPAIYTQMMATARNEFYQVPPTITTLAPLMNTYNVAYSFLPKAPSRSDPIIEVI